VVGAAVRRRPGQRTRLANRRATRHFTPGSR
jgi:hypothetical protein